MTNYKDLVVWQKSIELVTDIYKLTKTFSKRRSLWSGLSGAKSIGIHTKQHRRRIREKL